MKEEWRPVVGYEGKYSVSNIGRVRSENRRGKRGRYIIGRVLKPQASGRGYVQVRLYDDDGWKMKRVHTLVAKSFLGDVDGLVVDHINCKRDDNRLQNLELVTPRENAIRRFTDKGKSRKLVGAHIHGKSGLFVSRIYVNGKTIKLGYYKTREEASKVYFDYRDKNGLS